MPNSKDSNEKSSSIENDRFSKILEEIKKGDQDYLNEQVRNKGAPGECKRLIKKGVDPRALLTKLEESLKEGKEYKYYIQSFLPALLREVTQSRELDTKKIEKILRITSDIIKRSGEKEYEYYIENFLPQLKKEITQSKKLDPTKRVEIEKIIMELITLDAVSKNDNKDHSDSTMQNQNTTAGAVEVPSGANTSKLSNDNGSDSGVSSREPSEESLESPINSRRSSISSVKEDEDQMHLEQVVEKEPEVSFQHVMLESRKKESSIPVSATLMTDDDHEKDPVKSEEKKDKKNVITTVQKLPVNEKKGEVKQPNNRNLHVALVAGCALSTIGCIVAGVMTSGLVGAGLLAMAAVFAIAAVAELHSNFLSSKLTSISVEPHVNDKELTACSRL